MKTAGYVILLFIASVSAQVQIPCEFAQTPRGYECRLPDVDLSTFPEFTLVGGTHLPGQNDQTVASFMSLNNNFHFFPTAGLARFPGLRHIKISGSEITELPALAVANRPLLETISLSNNYIDRIDVTAFQGTPNIIEFNLMFNRLRSIENSVFVQLPNLRVLDLSFNILERVPANALATNPSLMSINLNSNRISHINQTFFDSFVNITTFFFNANLCYSGSFFNLNLIGNRNDMFNRLQTCFIDGGVMFTCRFGREFEGISFDDRYTCLLRGLEASDQNKVINVRGFHSAGLTNADVTFAWVDNSNVRFVIRQLFPTFTNLVGLQISSANLEVIQENAFQGATNLRYLTIVLNNLRGLHDHAFQHATNLQEIHLWFNNLEYIQEHAFAGLTNLRELHLTGGLLEYIPTNTFAPLINLQVFEANNNLIPYIDSRWFVNNTQINRLSFDDNRIFAVHPTLIEMPLLTTLRLLRNVCIDYIFSITPQTRDEVRQALMPCFEGYPMRQQVFRMELTGELNVYDEEGNVIGVL